MSSQFLIFGAGGHAKVVLDSALEAGLQVAYLIDDNPVCTSLFGIPVKSRAEIEFRFGPFEYLVAIGNNYVRKRIYEELKGSGGTPASIIHPCSKVSRRAVIGPGSFVCAGAIVNADTLIGENCILNTACSVDHDCVIEAHVHIAPGARLGGNVQVGTGALIGIGSAILPGRIIEANAVIGGGALVCRDVPSNQVVTGVPARTQHA